MGLDMYAYSTPTKPSKEVDFEDDDAGFEIVSWRKHQHLHDWMEMLYRQKGGVAEDFNCVNVQLNLDDLDALTDALINGWLPHRDQVRSKQDLTFIRLARGAIGDGEFIYYSSWW